MDPSTSAALGVRMTGPFLQQILLHLNVIAPQHIPELFIQHSSSRSANSCDNQMRESCHSPRALMCGIRVREIWHSPGAVLQQILLHLHVIAPQHISELFIQHSSSRSANSCGNQMQEICHSPRVLMCGIRFGEIWRSPSSFGFQFDHYFNR